MPARINLVDADREVAGPSLKSSALTSVRFFVGDADDPYKKYWLAVLACLGITGAWTCFPMMGSSVGSARMSAQKPGTDKDGAEQRLDSAGNPARSAAEILGLPTAGMRQSKDGGVDDMDSMLYQAPSGAGMAEAAGKPLVDTTADSEESLAQQLADVDKNYGKSDGKDAAGWGEPAQAGFLSKHLAAVDLQSLGLSGGASNASSSPGGGSIFGSRVVDPVFTNSHGLHDDGVGLRALKAAAVSAASSDPHAKDEVLHASAGTSFDGGQSNRQGTVGTSGLNALGQAQVAAGLAPANLKANEPVDTKKLPSTPPAATPPAAAQSMTQQLLMMAVTTIAGGLVDGLMGGGMAAAGGVAGVSPSLATSGAIDASVAAGGTMAVH